MRFGEHIINAEILEIYGFGCEKLRHSGVPKNSGSVKCRTWPRLQGHRHFTSVLFKVVIVDSDDITH